MLILCDFDNTITTRDVTHVLLDDFTDGKWREVQNEYERHEITHFEVMRRSYEYLKTPKDELIKYALAHIPLRAHFKEFVQYCREQNIELVVVSGGLNLYIEEFLPQDVPFYSYRSEYTGFWKVTLPDEFPVALGEDFKVKVLQKLLTQAENPHPVVFIGDGFNDQHAARLADYVFAVKNSNLDKVRQNEKLPTFAFSDFAEVTEKLPELKK